MLKNKVALVTGASSGIGRAIALVWAREGAKVVVSDVNVQAGEETAALVCSAGGDAIFVAADVGKPGDCEALVQRTVAHYGRLDVACNNAGIGGPQAPTADYPLDGWAQVININLSGVFYGMKYQIAAMLKKKDIPMVLAMYPYQAQLQKPEWLAYFDPYQRLAAKE